MFDLLDMFDMLTCWHVDMLGPCSSERVAAGRSWATRRNWSDLLYRITVSGPKWSGGAGTCSGSGWVSMLNWSDVL